MKTEQSKNTAAVPVQKITLVDKGQDFLEWYVRDGIVIDCQPFQGQMWVGVKLVYPQRRQLIPGQIINLISPINGKVSNLNYPVATIETLSPEEAEKVEGYGRKWADIKGVSRESLGL